MSHTIAPHRSAFTFNGKRPSPAAQAPQPIVFQAPATAPCATTAKPKPRPRPAQVLTVNKPAPRVTEIDGILIHPRVVSIADQHGTDLTLIALAVLEPEDTWLGKNGRSTVHLRGDLAAITADDSGEVIAVASRSKALRERTEPRDGAIARGHGGSGPTMPTTVPDLIQRLRSRGFGIVRDGNHYIARHHLHGGHQVSFAKTPSDHRSIPNTVLDIRAEFGIDVRQDA